MKIKEQLEQSRILTARYHQALTGLVSGNVMWSGPQMVTRIGGMPEELTRIGMVYGPMPLVIVDIANHKEVMVVTPNQAAQWPWPTVDKFYGLPVFLRMYANLDGPVNVHTPSYAWIRKEVDACETMPSK